MSKKSKFNNYKPQSGQSFSGFSSSYPGGMNGHRVSYSQKMRRRAILKWILIVLGIIALFFVGYLVTNVMLNISKNPIETTKPAQTTHIAETTTTEPATTPAVSDDAFQSLWANSDILNGGQKLQNFITLAKSSSANAVVIDFKDESGYLAYTTALQSVPKASQKARTAVDESIKALQNNGIVVIARINCFKDQLAARAMRMAAVHYRGNAGMLWLDKSVQNGGQPWLNPYSAQAKEYLFGVIKEIDAMGVNYIMLDAVRLPKANLNSATFDGEKDTGALSRNGILIDFIDSAVSSVSKSKIICVMNADAVKKGSSSLYDGTLWGCKANIFAIDCRDTNIQADTVFPKEKTIISIVKKADTAVTDNYIVQ